MPLVVACDEEGGDVTRLQASGGSSLPGAAALGAVDDTDLTRRSAESYGRLIAAAGVNLALAPVLDVASEPLNPVIGVRSFGADPDLVIRHGRATIDGLAASGVGVCAKHWPGHGATRTDSHAALPVLTDELATLRERDFRPFLEVAPPAIMTAHVVVPELGDAPATLSPWAQDELRQAGFDGVVVTDALGMRAISEDLGLGEASVRALEAGADLLCLDAPHERDARASFFEAFDAIVEALTSGRLQPERLAASAARNRTLASRFPPTPAAAPVEELVHELDEIGLEAARRSLEIRGLVQVRRPVLLVEPRRRFNFAAGRASNPFVQAICEGFPGSELAAPATAEELVIALDDWSGSVVLLTREPFAHGPEMDLLERALEQRPDAVVVHTGVAAAAPREEGMICCHGVGRANARAVLAALLGER